MELQTVELHFTDHPPIDLGAIKSRAEELLGGKIDSTDSGEFDRSCSFFHLDHVIKYADGGELPAQTVLMAADKKFELNDYASDIQQSWSTPNAADVLTTSKHTLLVMEMMARALEASNRLTIFHGVLQAVVEITSPIALVFKHIQQIIDPAAYLRGVDDTSIQAGCVKRPVL